MAKQAKTNELLEANHDQRNYPAYGKVWKNSIICLFRIAVGPNKKFGLNRVRITESFMFRLRDKREMRTDQF